MLTEKHKVIAVCVADMDTDYNSHFLKELTSQCNKYNYKLLIFSAFDSLAKVEKNDKHSIGESAIFNLINYDILDGLIIFSSTIASSTIIHTIIDRARKHNLPVISIDSQIDDCINISFKHDNTVKNIITHLAEKHNYKNIAFIGDLSNESITRERLNIYKTVLTEHDIPIREEYIVYSDQTVVSVGRAVDTLLSSGTPEAIVCVNDFIATSSIYYLCEKGFTIPEDMAVTGFDGVSTATHNVPSMLTGSINYEEVVQAAFDTFDKFFNDKPYEKFITVESKVIDGGSCGCEPGEFHKLVIAAHKLFSAYELERVFGNQLISISSDIVDASSFQSVFERLMTYSSNFFSHRFWLCIVDNFLISDEEISDIIEENAFKRNSYSNRMDVVIAKHDNCWEGMVDFDTQNLLPKLETILEEEDNLMFLPLHALDHTIGYVSIVYEPETMQANHLYRFIMHVSTALETTKIQQRQQSIISKLETKYVHDPLTGLFNRRGFDQKISPIYDACVKEGRKIMVISIDLNGLKPINDTYGHADGDIAISTIGKALLNTIRGDEVCARFGGDEYVAAGPIEDDSRADSFRADFQNYIDEFNKTSNKPYQISASIGIVVGVPTKDIKLNELIKCADEEMYKEKVKHHQCRN